MSLDFRNRHRAVLSVLQAGTTTRFEFTYEQQLGVEVDCAPLDELRTANAAYVILQHNTTVPHAVRGAVQLAVLYMFLKIEQP
jgi:hypothetical protein